MLSVRGLSPFQSDFQVTSRVQAQRTESEKDPECLVHCEQFQHVLMLLIHQVSEEEAVSLSGPSTALTPHFFIFISHPLIKIQVSHCLKPHMLTPFPWPFDPTSFSTLFSSSVSIRSPQPPSSSFPHPGRRAPSACVLAAREGPDIWPRSGPGRPTHPWSALPPYNVAVRTSCGRH